MKERFSMVYKQKSCMRCLAMGRCLEGKKDTWWPQHESYCSTKFVCETDSCANLPKEKQRHLTVCTVHYKDNKAFEIDFVSKLSPNKFPIAVNKQRVK